jgi:hypothetical protein
MPFGLTNAPATFQGIMNTIFAEQLRKYVLVFVDDILIYSESLEAHQNHLQQVFQILRANQLFIKKSKCTFAQPQLEYLGHIIGEQGVQTDPAKIQAVQDWPNPTNHKQLRGFLGLSGYYRKFIKNYGAISRPLTDLLKKNTPFVWTPALQESFDTLKTALVEAPVLALPDFTKPFVLETDASDQAIGAVLMQQGHPIAYLSKALGPKAQAMSAYEKECLALMMAVTKWKSYLQHQEFVIATDHQSLVHLGQQKLQQGLQQKAFIKLMGLQYRIVYKKGKENKVVDALSRQVPANPEELQAISTSIPRWLEIVVEGYHQDPEARQLLAELSISSPNIKGCSLTDGVIRHHGKIWLGKQEQAHDAVLQALHNSGLGGHSGIAAIYNKVKSLFSWPGIKQDVTTFVNNCQVCQQSKSEHSRLPGLLQPLPVPTQAWYTIRMDFIEGLPKSRKYDSILVVIDKFSKYAHFLPLTHPYTATTVAQVFFDQVYKLHGLPTEIITDRDRIFTSTFWQTLFHLAETYLRCMTHACPAKWANWLSLAEFWYNTNYNSAHGKTPFEVLYGHPPRHFGISHETACNIPDLNLWLQDRADMTNLIHQNLLRA